ncbi:zinc ribbon domain-containing protein [Paludibacterium denitrificans]|uniref:DZANK-type domain-containing protein n=1 Tax=Paludibacterium denitrificans TaxID=2675226 RepID=A0A844GG31_9NEIS|nr:zinc ribbon domain-containing protein [Paludibacterium denitrificans]MTD33465.1 hypothetical protein [Paludibacterium denitrificans]
MATCPACHTQNREDAHFCRSCGTALSASPAVATTPCPDCGTANKADSHFCKKCGHDLRPNTPADIAPALAEPEVASAAPAHHDPLDVTPVIAEPEAAEPQQQTTAQPESASAIAAAVITAPEPTPAETTIDVVVEPITSPTPPLSELKEPLPTQQTDAATSPVEAMTPAELAPPAPAAEPELKLSVPTAETERLASYIPDSAKLAETPAPKRRRPLLLWGSVLLAVLAIAGGLLLSGVLSPSKPANSKSTASSPAGQPMEMAPGTHIIDKSSLPTPVASAPAVASAPVAKRVPANPEPPMPSQDVAPDNPSPRKRTKRRRRPRQNHQCLTETADNAHAPARQSHGNGKLRDDIRRQKEELKRQMGLE